MISGKIKSARNCGYARMLQSKIAVPCDVEFEGIFCLLKTNSKFPVRIQQSKI